MVDLNFMGVALTDEPLLECLNEVKALRVMPIHQSSPIADEVS
jgi:hypothetical protein